MRNNNTNDEFEDLYSNSPSKPKFDVTIDDSEFEDISSFSDDYGNNTRIKYNSSAENRRRQEYSFDDADSVYGNMIPEAPKTPKKKSKKALRVIAVLLVLALIFTGCAGYYGYKTAKKLVNKITVDEPLSENAYISKSELYNNDNQINVLLVGTDAREQDTKSRSDTMILVTVDYKNGEIKLTSFLRDSYVKIAREGNYKSKLNSAYYYGGIQMLIDTLELNFKVKIPYYAVVDFEIFEKIIDKLGGIDVEVTAKEAKYINSRDHMTEETKSFFTEKISEGVNHFTGGQALWYARIRYLDSDFMRTQRQRKVITAIINKASKSAPKELFQTADELLPMIRTNIPSDDIVNLGWDAVKNKAYGFNVVQHIIPADKTWSNKTISGVGDCLVLDFDENVKQLQDFLKNPQNQ